MQAEDLARPGPEGGRIEPAEPEPPPALFICKVGQGMQGVVYAAGVQNDTPCSASLSFALSCNICACICATFERLDLLMNLNDHSLHM